MTSIFYQLKKELFSFFHSPIAYALLAASAILNGIVFLLLVEFLSNPNAPHQAAMKMLFGGTIFFWIVIMVFTPLLTMRLIAQEKNLGTIETLLTAPVSVVQVVVAKFISAVVFYTWVWLPTLLYPVIISSYSPVDTGPVISGYLGTISLGVMFLSVGLFFSSLTKNQIIAALLSFAGVMILFMLGIFGFISSNTSPDNTMSYMNLWDHMDDFSRGIVDTRHLVYYFSTAGFFVFCTTRILGAGRWSR